MTPSASTRFVSRGGEKLDGALSALGIDVTGLRTLDAGAATGGFTDCLLARGANACVAVDVSYGQFAWRLRNDPRVTLLERTNIRELTLDRIGTAVDFVVADLAFISLRAVRDALLGLCTPDAGLVLLVKPQFELPKHLVERGGVIRDPGLWAKAMTDVADDYAAAGRHLVSAVASSLTGPKGNREFFVYLRPACAQAGGVEALIAKAIESAP